LTHHHSSIHQPKQRDTTSGRLTPFSIHSVLPTPYGAPPPYATRAPRTARGALHFHFRAFCISHFCTFLEGFGQDWDFLHAATRLRHCLLSYSTPACTPLHTPNTFPTRTAAAFPHQGGWAGPVEHALPTSCGGGDLVMGCALVLDHLPACAGAAGWPPGHDLTLPVVSGLGFHVASRLTWRISVLCTCYLHVRGQNVMLWLFSFLQTRGAWRSRRCLRCAAHRCAHALPLRYHCSVVIDASCYIDSGGTPTLPLFASVYAFSMRHSMLS